MGTSSAAASRPTGAAMPPGAAKPAASGSMLDMLE
jgi:hypothetical protein